MDKETGYSQEIDLVHLAKVLVKRKWFIILGTCVFTAAVLLVTLVLPKVYKSSGFFQLSRGMDIDLKELKDIQDKIREDLQNEKLDNVTMQNNLLLNDILQDTSLMMKNVSIPDYKKYESLFTNPQQFLRFIDNREKTGDIDLGHIKDSVRTSEDISRWLEPVYAYSKKDLRDLAQSSKDVKNFVLGIRISGEQYSPQQAKTFVSVMGLFIKDSILYGKMADYIDTQLNRGKTEYNKNDNFIVKDEFKLKQLTDKRKFMEGVLKKYPRSKEMLGRELYSLENSGHRYLSPVAQLVGIESHIADINENLAQNRRNKELMGLKFDFFSKAKEILGGEYFGQPLLEKITGLKETFFSEKKLPPDITRQVKNDLAVDLDNFMNLNAEIEFISGPTLSKRPVKPRKVLVVAVALMVGFFLFIFLAFFIDWWMINKKKITEQAA
jgi:LPS O-antigen subunit length determinant protein (WzzB/FepE family)